MLYDWSRDANVPIAWPDAFELVGSSLRGLERPHQASCSTHGAYEPPR